MKHLSYIIFGLCTLLFARAQEKPSPDATPASGEVNADYTLRAGDRIQVHVHNEDDFSATRAIDSSGQVKLPSLGLVYLAGKTSRDAERLIESALSGKGFLKSPEVSIEILSFARRQFTIEGEVNGKGNIQFPGDTMKLDIVEAINLAGGFTKIANMKEVRVSRKNHDGIEEMEIINVERLLRIDKSDSRRETFYILPGDRIFVRPSIL